MANPTSTKSPRSKKPRSEQPPPSSVAPAPPAGSNQQYAIGVLLLLLFGGGLLYWKYGGSEPPPKPVAKAPPTATEEVQLPEFAPPPPPEEEEDAGAEEDAGKRPTSGGTKRVVAKGNGACSACGKGVPSNGLTSAVSGTAGLARGCYNRALRTGGAEGNITVSVSVGATGNLCSASITNDTLHNPSVSQCVLGKFKARSYPKPQSGCVVVNVPIAFKMKK